MAIKGFMNGVVLSAALTLGMAGMAHAVPASWDDWAGDSGQLISAGGPDYTYTHDITSGPNGYRPGIDSIGSASLSIWLYDDAFFGDLPLLGDGPESVGFNFDGSGWSSSYGVNGNVLIWDNFDFIVTSLLNDGLLTVSIRAYSGDFRFGASHVEARGDRATSVPEPATLTLLGFSLLGLGLVATKRRRS